MSEERLWRSYDVLGEENKEDRSRYGWAVSTGTRESPEQPNMQYMTELVGGESCLPQLN